MAGRMFSDMNVINMMIKIIIIIINEKKKNKLERQGRREPHRQRSQGKTMTFNETTSLYKTLNGTGTRTLVCWGFCVRRFGGAKMGCKVNVVFFAKKCNSRPAFIKVPVWRGVRGGGVYLGKTLAGHANEHLNDQIKT